MLLLLLPLLESIFPRTSSNWLSLMQWRVIERARLSRSQFERWFANRTVGRVVMEACGSAHHWGRWLAGLGIEVRLLPARYVRAYVKRNKTDAADAAALIEASRADDLLPVRVKSIEQQALQALHRSRSAWMATRTARINTLRGFCREFGVVISLGSRLGLEQMARQLADPASGLPELLRPTMRLLLDEIRLLEARISQLERELAQLARQSRRSLRLGTLSVTVRCRRCYAAPACVTTMIPTNHRKQTNCTKKSAKRTAATVFVWTRHTCTSD